jgi:hypothetical protein
MVRIVRERGLGVVARDFEPASLAGELRRLDRPMIEAYKRRAHDCARELSAERNAEIMRGVVASAIAGHAFRPAAPGSGLRP